MEEIDIIELLKRVKEGKAPKRIEIGSIFFRLVNSYASFSIEYWYEDDEENRWKIEEYTLYTKIKILDKPIIEELKFTTIDMNNGEYRNKDSILVEWLSETRIKINEIIKWINNKE